MIRLYTAALVSIGTACLAMPVHAQNAVSSPDKQVILDANRVGAFVYLKRGASITFTGKSSSGLSSTIRLRDGGGTYAERSIGGNEEWSVTWKSTGELRDAANLSIWQVSANRTETSVTETRIALYDSPPISLTAIRKNDAIKQDTPINLSMPEGVSCEKYAVWVDNAETSIQISTASTGTFDVRGLQPGDHTLFVRCTLAGGGGIIDTKALPVRVEPILDYQPLPSAGVFDFRPDAKKQEPEITIAFRKTGIVPEPIDRFVLSAGTQVLATCRNTDTGFQLPVGKLMQGDYPLQITMYTKLGSTFYSPLQTMKVLRDKQSELKNWNAQFRLLESDYHIRVGECDFKSPVAGGMVGITARCQQLGAVRDQVNRLSKAFRVLTPPYCVVSEERLKMQGLTDQASGFCISLGQYADSERQFLLQSSKSVQMGEQFVMRSLLKLATESAIGSRSRQLDVKMTEAQKRADILVSANNE